MYGLKLLNLETKIGAYFYSQPPWLSSIMFKTDKKSLVVILQGLISTINSVIHCLKYCCKVEKKNVKPFFFMKHKFPSFSLVPNRKKKNRERKQRNMENKPQFSKLLLPLLKFTSATKLLLLKICYLRNRLRIFLFSRKAIFHSLDIQVFVFLTIPSFSKSVMSWWVLVHERVHFWVYLSNYNSLSHQTWVTDRCKQGQYFSGVFWTIWRTGPKFQVFSI